MNNNRNFIQSPKTFVKTISIIHLALIVGQVMFAVVVFSLTKSTVINLQPVDDVFFYIVPVFVIAGILIGSFLFKQSAAKAAEAENVNKKLAGYQTAFIVRCALSEGASMFAIVCYELTANFFYLLLAMANMLYFIWLRPTKEKIEDTLNLSYEEKAAAGW